jgi:hypothetical protein
VALRDRRLAALIFFAALAAAHTWPLARDPAHLSRYDNADAALNTWTLAWVARTIVRDPARLFDAPMFHPERDALAFSEPLLLQGALAAPLVRAGAGPLLAFNLVLLAGLALSAWTMSLVIARWTGSGWAGLVAGSLFAFNTHLLARLPHLQAVHVEFLPLALAALDRLVDRARARDALALGIAYALQALSSGYLLVMGAVALVAGALARPADWGRPGRMARRAGLGAAAGAVAAGICLPVVLAHLRVRAAHGLVRPLAEVAAYSASPAAYLATVSRVYHALWSHRFYLPGGDALFPGVLALGLAALALLSGVAGRDGRARMLLAVAAAGAALSFGPAMPGYAWLHAWVPGFQDLRGAARFGFLALSGVAGLAGFGLARLLAHPALAAGRGRRAAVGVAALALVNLEALVAPMDFVRDGGTPRAYRVLQREPAPVVVELPFPPADRPDRNAPFLVAAAEHGATLVNGYSSFVPRSYIDTARALEGFPDSRAFARLEALGVTHLVVHLDALAGADRLLAAHPAVVLCASGPGLRIYRLRASLGGRR